MIKETEIKNLLYFDVETAGAYKSYEDLEANNPRLCDLWKKRTKYFKTNIPEMSDLLDSEIYLQKAGLEPEFGRVVCVSFGAWTEQGEQKLTSFYGEDERSILEKTVKVLNNASLKGMKLCGHNIKMFDVPFLGKRILFNEMSVPSSLQIWNKKPWEISFLDTAEFFSFGSWSQKFLGLDLLACSLGIDSPKDDMDGSKVHDTFWDLKEFDRIKEYCEKDVITVMDVLKKVSQ